MLQYRPHQNASTVNSSLQNADQALERAKKNVMLWFGDLVQRQLYRDLGYSNVLQYADRELGWSKSKTYDFLSICRKLEKLPKVKNKVASGKLGYAHAREVVKVTNEVNQDEWLEVALNSSRRQLSKEVKRAQKEAADLPRRQASLLPPTKPRPAAVVPSRVCLDMSPTQLARFELLWEKARKKGGISPDKVEALLEMMESFVAENSNRLEKTSSPKTQIHVHQCPDCQQATVQTAKGELGISATELQQAQCDAVLSQPGKRNVQTIAPKIRREVLSRDRHCCQRPGCGHSRFLEIHHKVPRQAGGTNDAANLITLCSACHRLMHNNPGAGFWVKSPTAVYRAGQILNSTSAPRSTTG